MYNKKQIDIGEEIKKRWFIIGILFTLLLAVLNPYVGASGGPLKTEYTVRYGAVVVIFLVSGVRLESGALSKATQKRELMFYIQAYSFFVVPMVVWLMSAFFNAIDINAWILRGLMTVSCMPPSISSGVVLTRAAGGDEAAAVFNTALGSVLGVFLTPLMLLYTAGSTTVAPLSRSILQLILTVLLPLSVGRLVFRPIFNLLKWDMSNQGYWVQLALLSMLYASFCDAILEHDADFDTFDVLITITLVVLILLVTSGISWFLAATVLAPADISAAVFCSTHKSLSMGLPMLRVMFGGDMGHTALLALPLLAHQPAQALLGAALAPHLQPVARSKLYV